MHGLTDYITDQPWVDTFTAWYVWVDEAYQAVVAHTGRLRTRGPMPTFSDSEVITGLHPCHRLFVTCGAVDSEFWYNELYE